MQAISALTNLGVLAAAPLKNMAQNMTRWADKTTFELAAARLRPTVSLVPENVRKLYFERLQGTYNPIVQRYLPDVDEAAYRAKYDPNRDAPTIFNVWQSKNNVLQDIVNMTDAEMATVDPKATPEMANLIRQMAATLDVLPSEANFLGRSAYDLVRHTYTQNPTLKSAPGLGAYITPSYVQNFIKHSKATKPAGAKLFQDPLAVVRTHIFGTASQQAFRPIASQTWNKGQKQTVHEKNTLVDQLGQVLNDPFGDPVAQKAAQDMLDAINPQQRPPDTGIGDYLTRVTAMSQIVSQGGPLIESAISHLGMTEGGPLANVQALSAALLSPQISAILDKFGVKGKSDLAKILDQANIQTLYSYESGGLFGPGYSRPFLLNPLPAVDAVLKRTTAGVTVLAAAKKLGPKYGMPDGIPIDQILNPKTPQMKAAAQEVKGLMGQTLNDVHGVSTIGNTIPETEHGAGRVLFSLRRARLAQADAKMRLLGTVVQQGVQGGINAVRAASQGQMPNLKWSPEAMQAARMIAVDFIASGPRAVLSPEVYQMAAFALALNPTTAPMAAALQNATTGSAQGDDNPIQLLMKGQLAEAVQKAGNFSGVLGQIDQILDTNWNKYTSPVLDVTAYVPDLDGLWDIKKQMDAGGAVVQKAAHGQPLTEDQLEQAISTAGALSAVLRVAKLGNLGISGPAAARMTNAVINASRGYRSSNGIKYPTNVANEAASVFAGGTGTGGHMSEINQRNAETEYQTLRKDFWNEFGKTKTLTPDTINRVTQFRDSKAASKYPDMAPDLATRKFLTDLSRPLDDGQIDEMTNSLYKAYTTDNAQLRQSLLEQVRPKLELLRENDPEGYAKVDERLQKRVDKLGGN